MLLNLWFRIRDVLIFLFIRDPVKELFIVGLDNQRALYETIINQERRTIEVLKLQLREREDEVRGLNLKLIDFLSPKEEVVTVTPYTPVVSGHSWVDERSRLEDQHSNERRKEVLRKVAERENEVADLIETALDSKA